MPPALEKLIPIIQPSSQRHISQNFKKSTRRAASRAYDEHYLPIAPSQLAPRHATISGRVADAGRVIYSLDIGGVEISDVGLHEILDYVSAFELERFENAQFVEERELLSILEEEIRQERQARRQYKRQQRDLQTEAPDTSDESNNDVAAAPLQAAVAPPAIGKHGRARPTYKHLYLQPKIRRRRKRDPDTGDLLSLSEDDGGGVTQEATRDVPTEESSKRRRRKRDKITGELLPLSPEIAPAVVTKPKTTQIYVDALPAVAGYVQDPDKRPRRRRHPITNELMPLGWKYAPAEDTVNVSPGNTFKDLSITGNGQPSAKRPRLQNLTSTTRDSSESLSSSGRRLVPSIVIDPIDSETIKSGRSGIRASVVTSSLPTIKRLDSDEAMADIVVPPRARTSLTNPMIERHSSTSSEASSTEVITVSSFQKPKHMTASPQARGKTSMLNPTMTPVDQSAGDSNDDSDDGEFVIEGILHHRMSDPKTHLPEFGHKPIRLYQVKWEGYDELTWEPVESFPDRSIIQEYHQRVGLKYGDSLQPTVRTSISDREKDTPEAQASPVPLPLSNDRAPRNNTPSANNTSLTSTIPLKNITPLTNDKPLTERKSHIGSKAPTESNPPRGSKPDVQPSRTAVSIKGNVTNANHVKRDSSSPPMPKKEYAVEAILGHHMSDPKTHPSGTENKPTMLYHVKWEGYDELTWEPIDSFPVRSIVLEYRERHGLHRTEDSYSVAKPKQALPQGSQKKEQQRMQWNALMAANQKSGKSTQQRPGDDSSDE
jgi:hypothetical protein